MRDTSLPVLKNIEVGGRYNKVKSESYLRPLYVPVKVTNLDSLRVVLKVENLNPMAFSSIDLHCVLLHFKKTWTP